MTSRTPDDASEDRFPGAPRVGDGYPRLQFAKALAAAAAAPTEPSAKLAAERVGRWMHVLQNLLSGAVDYGSRTPLRDVPAWATLEVATGGFATGRLIAGGPLSKYETERIERLGGTPADGDRSLLNAYYLTDEGLAELADRLRHGDYRIDVPEEGALPVVAWLVDHEQVDAARRILDVLAPYFATLRLYPPADAAVPRRPAYEAGASPPRVHLLAAGEAIERLRGWTPNPRVLAQREAVEIWAPYFDRLVALALEAFETFAAAGRHAVLPAEWSERTSATLREYPELRARHRRCGKPDKVGGHFFQLRGLLAIAAERTRGLSDDEFARLRTIVFGAVRKRGAPGTSNCEDARRRQREHVAAPLHAELAAVAAERLAGQALREGVEDPAPFLAPVEGDEARRHGIRERASLPPSVRRVVERCWNATVEELVGRGLITSADVVARVLPQYAAELRAAGLADPAARRLYAAIDRAFRRRRSLLLVDLQSQVRIEELPWVAALETLRTDDADGRSTAGRALRELTLLVLRSFPHAILPNKFLDELRTLAKTAQTDLPLVEELAADIFQGKFSPKFDLAARIAADLLRGTLYDAYYDLAPRRIADHGGGVEFAAWCSARAQVTDDEWSVARNGMIVEQQQILTTQNLATLVVRLDLRAELTPDLPRLPRRCFTWIVERMSRRAPDWHSQLVRVKNVAYAWRQMIFFLALLDEDAIAEFLAWAREGLAAGDSRFAERFQPAMRGLERAAAGEAPEGIDRDGRVARRLLGWSRHDHWLVDS